MIELMKIEDLDEVLAIEEELFTSPWKLENFKNELSNELGKVFVEKVDDHIVSYGSIWFMFENCDINKIAVRKDLWHQGFGQKMLDHLIQEASNNNCEFVHLEVRTNNIAALNLYRKNGFMIMRKRDRYYENGEDGYDMARNVVKPEAKKLLAIESSCDETACAIIDENLNVLSSVVTSQIDVHARFGGVIPEVASRMHVEQVSAIVKEAIDKANISVDDV